MGCLNFLRQFSRVFLFITNVIVLVSLHAACVVTESLQFVSFVSFFVAGYWHLGSSSRHLDSRKLRVYITSLCLLMVTCTAM